MGSPFKVKEAFTSSLSRFIEDRLCEENALITGNIVVAVVKAIDDVEVVVVVVKRAAASLHSCCSSGYTSEKYYWLRKELNNSLLFLLHLFSQRGYVIKSKV